jgi:hypothetical protein
MYTNVIFQEKTNASSLKVFVEKKELKFNDQGIASIALLRGQQYYLYCFASGKPGTSYELSIIEPKDIPLSIFKIIDNSKEDKGKYAFSLSLTEKYSAHLW